MHVGILTFNFAINYGAVIQAFALQTFLRAHGYDAWVIDYDPRRRRCPWWVYAMRRGWRYFSLELKFRLFRRRNLLEKSQLSFDAYVVGSDQVWNLAFFKEKDGHFNRFYFLNFVTKAARKISYAASVGEGGWDDDAKELSQLLSSFDAVSVRENFAKEVVQKVCEQAVYVVPDPSLLISADSYLKMCGRMCQRKSKLFRVFIYGLNAQDRCFKLWDSIRSKLPPAEVRCVSFDWSISCPRDVNRINVSPAGWLREIMSADLVVTDSFHGVALSARFQKNFYTFIKSEEPNSADRIVTLLQKIGLENRIVNLGDVDHINVENIDYDAVNLKLDEFRSVGESFLLNALQHNETSI